MRLCIPYDGRESSHMIKIYEIISILFHVIHVHTYLLLIANNLKPQSLNMYFNLLTLKHIINAK